MLWRMLHATHGRQTWERVGGFLNTSTYFSWLENKLDTPTLAQVNIERLQMQKGILKDLVVQLNRL